MKEPRLVRVKAPHFVAGFLVDEETRTIVEAAPILRWTLKRSWDDVWREMKRRGWEIYAYPPRS